MLSMPSMMKAHLLANFLVKLNKEVVEVVIKLRFCWHVNENFSRDGIY
ncbi:hypothetical protein T11_4276 [Trichinella zimbabwensis]|uniref:Uncharacterized protein n=1 Tax=Trichinella zimbabwensis TaxID=268475 RepID=A0A0V1G8A3_9BILA|nr:hypothetical protein T11_4276 [Trichinella zimbabwensis]